MQLEKNQRPDYSFEGTFYRTPGTADMLLEFLRRVESEQKVAVLASRGTLAYLRGELDEAFEWAKEAENCGSEDFYDRLSIEVLLGVCAMYRGDIPAWEAARKNLTCLPCETKEQEDIAGLWLGGYDSNIYVFENFPEWLCKGRLDVLPAHILPYAQVLYAKYQLVKYKNSMWAISDGEQNRGTQSVMISQICEPIAAMLAHEGAVVPEMRMRLICATGYRLAGEDEDAAYHIDRAIKLALPDALYAPLAEYRGHLDSFFDERLKAIDAQAFEPIRKLSISLTDGWGRIHNHVTHRRFSVELSMRERETARLAAFGLSNKEISQRLNVSMNTVHTHLKAVFDKTGVSKRSQLKDYII